MFINSEAIVPFLIMMDILILLIVCLALGLAIWAFRKLYKRITGRDMNPIVLLAGAALIMLLVAPVVVVLLS